MSEVQNDITQVQRETGACMEHLERLDSLKTKLQVCVVQKLRQHKTIQFILLLDLKAGSVRIRWLGSTNFGIGRLVGAQRLAERS